MGDCGSDSVGGVFALERRESSGDENGPASPLDELPLWSCCSTAGRSSEKCPYEPRSAMGLTGESTWDSKDALETGLRRILVPAGIGGKSEGRDGMEERRGVPLLAAYAACSSSGSVTSATACRLLWLVRFPRARFELCV